ncbi:hypothetical protein ACLB2K_031571 [Fragaria x ananassa]
MAMNSVSLEMYADMLSNLPSHLFKMIISRLLIQEAFRTSILSTEWRHTARGLSQLVFEAPPTWSEARLINAVDHVLLNHDLGLIKFMVFGDGREDIGAVDRWVSRVSDLSVQELTLQMSHGHNNWWPLHEASDTWFVAKVNVVFTAVLAPPHPLNMHQHDQSRLDALKFVLDEKLPCVTSPGT